MEVKAKVDESPLNAFTLVFLLLQDEHGMVEELLQLLIGVVDTQLLEGVELEQMMEHDANSVIQKLMGNRQWKEE